MVQHRTIAELWNHSADLERLAGQTPKIDVWCSGPDWTLSTHEGFAADAERFIVGDFTTGVGLFARYRNLEEGNGAPTYTISGLEPLWGFACPVLGPDPVNLIEQLTDTLSTVGPDYWDRIVLPGLPLDADLLQAMAKRLSRLGPVGTGIAIERELADLRGGVNSWFERRSSKFRRNLRRAERAAVNAGVRFIDVSTDDNVFDRFLGIEASSWKGQEQSGITSTDMERTYRIMVQALQRNGRLRATIAQLDGSDIGFIFGGERARTYRGLQVSYLPSVAHLSIGHLLQWTTLSSLPPTTYFYDLGMSIDYKQAWSDVRIPSVVLITQKPPKSARFSGL